MVEPATSHPPTAMERQPVAVLLSGLAGVVALGLAAATALDWVDLSTEQAAAVIAFIVAVTGLIGAALWGKVYSPATVAEMTGPNGGTS